MITDAVPVVDEPFSLLLLLLIMAVDGFELSELADVAIVEDILLCCYTIMVTQLTLEDNDKTSSSIG